MICRLIPIALVALACGCVPRGVAWRPDSSGFIYTDKDFSRLVLFDLKTKSTRVLVNDTDTKSALPATSPDGKRIAVARSEHREGLRPRLQVRIYSAGGREEKRSRW